MSEVSRRDVSAGPAPPPGGHGATGEPAGAATEASAIPARRPGRLQNLIVLAVAAALVAVGAWWMGRGDTPADASEVEVTAAAEGPAPEIGSPAPDFTARTTDGRTVQLSDYRGQPVWVSFVATWCSACRAEAPDMQTVHAEQGEDVVLLSVYLNEDAGTVQTYADRLGMAFTHLPDAATELAAQFRVMAVPTHFFIDGDGVLRSTHVGAMSKAQMDEAVAALASN